MLVEILTLSLLLSANYSPRWWGLALMMFALTSTLQLVETFFRSYYFGSIITNDYPAKSLFTFTVGRILYQPRDDDLLAAFVQSKTGSLVLRRLGINPAEARSFLDSRKESADRRTATLTLAGSHPLTLRQLGDWLYTNDESFAKFLFRFQVNGADLSGAIGWVVQEIEAEARKERWWSRDRLERVAGLAKDWAYGHTPTLERYSQDLLLAEQAADFTQAISFRSDEVRQLQDILLRRREANALLIGPPSEAKMDVVWQLVNEIKSGIVNPVIEHRRPVLLHAALLLADCRDKEKFELTILKLVNEAAQSGNVILVIDDLPVLLTGAERLGSNLASLLGSHLVNPQLPIIALADVEAVAKSLNSWSEFLRRFEQLKIVDIDQSRLLMFLEQTAGRFEHQSGVFFTYPAIKSLAESAERYFQNESTADRALDLLVELVPWAVNQAKPLIGREEVLEFVGSKTRIPLGAVKAPERQLLLGLEDSLRRQIIGQETAIIAISRALRRGRAGTQNSQKPIGTFLFLGPTGVGKTETAKALARVLFGREEALLRLDMSEYQASDALNRLIGSFADNRPGILANLLRQNPYGILLLDEFEKTEREVLNLFLQILDEGFFSDAFSRRVNTRNIIFIATSNAGAEMIWQMVQAGQDPAQARGVLIDTLIQQAIFRPELLNRFDEIVIFHPLSPTELQAVARLLLQRLVTRLRGQGIELRLDEVLISQVAARGSDRVFGARPMNRFIQNYIEQAVADQVVSGQLRPGAVVCFKEGKLTAVN